MRAQGLVQAVYETEKRLRADIADIVQRRLLELSEATGLMLGDVRIATEESTNLGSRVREWRVTHVNIDHELPRIISMG